MFRRALSAALGSCALLTALTTPAHAATTPRPLTLATYQVVVFGPTNIPDTGCDYYAVNCGGAGVRATFSGLTGRDRTGTPNSRSDGDLVGTIEVTRVYGCADATGKRLHRYDTRVTETDRMDTRIGSGYRIPADGDTLASNTYAFLGDAQPRNCPAGTTAMVYKLVARHATLTIQSNVPSSIPNHTYRAPGVARWLGAVATPGVPA